MTPVIFRKHGDEITAVFPSMPEDYEGRFMTCYAHVGQHSGCCKAWYLDGLPATPEEYADLLQELNDVGYHDIRVFQRVTSDHRAEFRCALMAWR